MRRSPVRDGGIASPVELVFLAAVAVVGVLLVGHLGRLHAAGVQVAGAAQSAARAASLADGPRSAAVAADTSVGRSSLTDRCIRPPVVELRWEPSPSGSWRGGSVTVTVRCTVDGSSLGALWSAGERTIAMSDTQPIDRFRP